MINVHIIVETKRMPQRTGPPASKKSLISGNINHRRLATTSEKIAKIIVVSLPMD